jgi:solute carrier family 25 protein 39/40
MAVLVPQVCVYLTAYDFLKGHLQAQSGPDRTPLAPALAGMGARLIALSVVSPLELLRTSVQALGPRARAQMSVGAFSMLRMSFAQHGGFRVWWRGLVPSAARDVPFSALYWSLVERSRSHMQQKVRRRRGLDESMPLSLRDTLLTNTAAGTLSGLVAATACTPADVVKTRMQGDLLAARTPTLREAVHQVWHVSGWRGFFSGLQPRLARVPPGCAIVVSTYEVLKAWLARRDEKKLNK